MVKRNVKERIARLLINVAYKVDNTLFWQYLRVTKSTKGFSVEIDNNEIVSYSGPIKCYDISLFFNKKNHETLFREFKKKQSRRKQK